MELTGTIKEIYKTQQISDKFKKREFVLTETSTQYPQDLLIQCTQDKCSLLDFFKAGESATVSINLRGKEYTDKQGIVKYFNSIEAWKIAKSGNEPASTSKVPNVNVDDLPF